MILLINPNSSTATTAMMLDMAREAAGPALRIAAATAARAPAMITDAASLDAAAAEVVEIGVRDGAGCAGIIVAAFGDPGAAELRRLVGAPVIGIGAAAMVEAAGSGRRFAVATTTSALAGRIGDMAAQLGLAAQYAGSWVTPGDPVALTGDPALLEAALAEAVWGCIREGGAEAVIIGGGPLSRAAAALQGRFAVPIVAPVAAAVRGLMQPPVM